jgi:FixJ family two-component response regulator
VSGSAGGPATALVHLVEDDEPARVATARFLRASGYEVRTYASAEEFLAATPHTGQACLLLDVKLPGASGLDLQRHMPEWAEALPIVFLTGQSDIPHAVEAMKSGAVDFLTKTADGSELIAAVSRAMARCALNTTDRERKRAARASYARLTPREQEVFAHLISGQLNKQIGFDLGITERTVKIHRHQVLAKMQANSVADLVRLAADLGVTPTGTVR